MPAAVCIVDDADLTPAFVADTVAGLLNDAGAAAAMTAAAALAGHRDAAQRVARGRARRRTQFPQHRKRLR